MFMHFKHVTSVTTLRKCFHVCFSTQFITVHLQLIKNIDHGLYSMAVAGKEIRIRQMMIAMADDGIRFMLLQLI